MPQQKTKLTLADLSTSDREELRRELLQSLLDEGTKPPLTITDIREMTPEDVINNRAQVDAFLETWDGSEPEPDGEAA